MTDTQPTFAHGDIVNVTISGARVVGFPSDVLCTEYDLASPWMDDAKTFKNNLVLNAPGLTVERVAPAEWPPRPGDLWRDNHGALWFASESQPDAGDLRMHTATGTRWSVGHDGQLEDNGPWTLVYREDSGMSA